MNSESRAIGLRHYQDSSAYLCELQGRCHCVIGQCPFLYAKAKSPNSFSMCTQRYAEIRGFSKDSNNLRLWRGEFQSDLGQRGLERGLFDDEWKAFRRRKHTRTKGIGDRMYVLHESNNRQSSCITWDSAVASLLRSNHDWWSLHGPLPSKGGNRPWIWIGRVHLVPVHVNSRPWQRVVSIKLW